MKNLYHICESIFYSTYVLDFTVETF